MSRSASSHVTPPRRWAALLATLVALLGAGCAGSLPVETVSHPGCDRNGDREQRVAC